MQSQIHELMISLQKEYLFICNEKNEIINLFKNIQSIYDDLYRKKYILNSQQLINIEYHNESFELEHIKTFFMLESKISFTKFSSVYRHCEHKVIELIKRISNDEQLITNILLFSNEKNFNILRLCSVIYKSLLDSAISKSDNEKVISVLLNLIDKQFNISIEPQQVIIGEKCPFIRMFKLYIDNSLSAKTFLIATLQEPIEFILMNDEIYLDVNSKYTLERLSQSEKWKLFGDPKSNMKYQQNILTFRNNILNKIVEAVNMFVKKLTESFNLLPHNYIIIVNKLYQTLSNNQNIKKVDVLLTCVDFIFDWFIYPAMLNPESYGIIGDFPISFIAKHNLLEICKVIKSLIYKDISKAHNIFECSATLSLPTDLLEKFEDNFLQSFLAELSIWSESNISNSELDNDQKPVNSVDLNRSVMLISESDLYFLLKTLRCYTTENSADYSWLITILDNIKQIGDENALTNSVKNRDITSLTSSLKEEFYNSKFYSKTEEGNDSLVNSKDLNVFILVDYQYSECPGMKSEEKVIKDLKCRFESSNEARRTYNGIFHSERNSRKQNTDNSESSRGHPSCSRQGSSSSRSCASSGETSSCCRKLKESSIDKANENSVKPVDQGKISMTGPENRKRKTHFNESNDQESTGAPSDIVEGISEIASTHSAQSEDVDSRLDIDENNDQSQNVLIENNNTNTAENQINYIDTTDSNENAINIQSMGSGDREPANTNDIVQSAAGSIIHNSSIVDLEELRTSGGLDDGSSDLVYWPNMSGRDTPSISGGRESPSSSVGGSDLPNNVKPDVTEKFWKFDIPKTVEARSTVSDTWSTDVLASDSETTEQGDNIRRLVEILEERHPSNQSQIASGSEDNSEAIDLSVKILSNCHLFDKLDSITNKSLNLPIKAPTSQHNQSTDTLTNKDSVTHTLNNRLDNSIGNIFLKIKPGNLSRSTIVSGRNTRYNYTLPALHNNSSKEEDKPRPVTHAVIEPSTSGSPISTPRQLVHKIRDKLSGNRLRKDSKTTKNDICETKSITDEIGTNTEKPEKENSAELPESVEQMLLRYDDKTDSRTTEYVEAVVNNVEEQSSVSNFFDPKTPPEGWPAWKVTKTYLRRILEKHYLQSNFDKLFISNRSNNDTHPLRKLLRLYLAEANLLQNHLMIAQLEEAIRLIQLFDNESLSRMISSMLKEWKQRKAYISYLVSTHIELRMIKKQAKELLLRCKRSCQVTSRSMISFCVHQILRQQNQKVEEFCKKFYSTSTYENTNNSCVSKTDNDEINNSTWHSENRVQLVSDMLDWASRILNNQPYFTSMVTERQHEARIYLERMVMSQLHRSSIFLNDDIAEIDRDNIFHREVELLQKVIKPSDLSIKEKFFNLLPFEVAQKELLKINCYKTPLDKVFCVEKTTEKISILLKMINSDFTPGADEILPALTYVIIMYESDHKRSGNDNTEEAVVEMAQLKRTRRQSIANPPRLLSNMSFVEALCGSQLKDLNQYLWFQFKMAVSKVKLLLTEFPRYKK